MATHHPPALLCIGRNYADHAAEMGNDPLEHPILFFKNPASVIGDGEPIIIPSICDQPSAQVDYEAELAVILARDCRDVPETEALRCVSGYAAANDVSARWWQKHGSGGQYSRGMTLLAGSIILTGTPSGVGSARKPPRFLKDGDTIEVEIPGVGRVRNPVRHE